MDVDQLRRAFLESHSLVERVANFHRERVQAMRSDQFTVRLMVGPAFALHVVPIAGLSGERIDLQLAKRAAEEKIRIVSEGCARRRASRCFVAAKAWRRVHLESRRRLRADVPAAVMLRRDLDVAAPDEARRVHVLNLLVRKEHLPVRSLGVMHWPRSTRPMAPGSCRQDIGCGMLGSSGRRGAAGGEMASWLL